MESDELIQIIPSIIVPFLALWGAILSTIIFFHNRKNEKPQIEITNDLEINFQNGEPSNFRNFIIARNIGIKPVTFASAFIEESNEPQRHWWKRIVPNDKKRFAERTTDPFKFENGKEVLSGKSLEVDIYRQELYDAFGDSTDRFLIAVFIDQIGNRYQSKPFYSTEIY